MRRDIQNLLRLLFLSLAILIMKTASGIEEVNGQQPQPNIAGGGQVTIVSDTSNLYKVSY